MYTVLILSVLAAVNAAPHYHQYHHGPPNFPSPRMPPRGPYPGFGQELFDTNTFWNELAKEMQELDEMLKDFYVRFPSSISKEGIEGDHYKIVITLHGYKESEITVKAREGVLMIQAVQTSGGNQRSYIDVRTLPNCVSLSGTWTYDNDVLTIQFPLKPEQNTELAVTEEIVTEGPVTTEVTAKDREEMGQDNDDAQDVDVGARGDNDKETELLTNEIPDKSRVEATTYAVDLQNEVEFVPVHY